MTTKVPERSVERSLVVFHNKAKSKHEVEGQLN